MTCAAKAALAACHHAAVKTQIVFVPVDGRKVFLVCCLLIAACLIWLGLWASKGIKFEESS